MPKPTLYLVGSIAALVIYVVVLLALSFAHGPVVPLQLNTALLIVLASLLLVSAMWCMVDYSRTLQDRRAESVKACVAELLGPIATAQAEHSVKFEEMRRLIRMRPVAHGAVVADLARLEAAIEGSDRDRDKQLAMVHDAIGLAKAEAAGDLKSSMAWVLQRFEETGR